MKFGKWMYLTPLTLIVAVAISHNVAAQDPALQTNRPKHHRYRLIDMGTLGGPQSVIASLSSPVNSSGIGTAVADTSIPDPFSPNCLGQSCLVAHAAEWNNGTLTDLGALPGVNTSMPFYINDLGGIVGISENGLIDPLTGFPEVVAVYWNHGKIIDLGTFGGNASYANAINNEGQIVGMALNTVPDSYSSGIGKNTFFAPAFPVATQSRAFLWQQGVMHDLGTLGGNDAQALFVNDRGQVAGMSYTNTVANPSTGLPTQDPFFWEDGKMVDIGTLGGTNGVAYGLNNRGQVVGGSNLAGDKELRPFLWDKKEGLRDLGSLGGTMGAAIAVNDSGIVVGNSSLPGGVVFHAFIWENGVMTDLGTVAGLQVSAAFSINSKRQVVGEAGPTPPLGWLWEDSGPIVDLNQLVLPGSDLTVVGATYINDRGEIAAQGALPNGDSHAILLIPDGDCDDACEARIADSQSNPPNAHVSSMSNNRMPAMRGRLARKFQSPSLGPSN